ncbi:MAG: hypothetical protein CL933_24150 [Deltaproteobacteria bacterium]|nr:hypothetical protein [Deltaproteobacteria bacterium]
MWIVLVSWLAQQAAARPLDLTDPSPRWIEVHFEVSPADEPGSLDQEWSAPRPGYLEPDPGSSPVALRIRIPADQIESHLRSIGTDAIVGSFSEFVWTLDPETGHVLEAAMTGRVRERLRFGPIRASAQVEIRVEMTTSARAGFEPGHGIMGVNTNRFCVPDHSRAHCVGVDPVRFDPTRGYVNAVGSVSARTPLAEIRAFSPLGEVKFLERAAPETETVVSGTSQAKALCSEAFDDPCGVNLGGES